MEKQINFKLFVFPAKLAALRVGSWDPRVIYKFVFEMFGIHK